MDKLRTSPVRRSLFFRFMVPLVVIMAGQAALFFGTTLWGRPMQKVEDNSYSVFIQQVKNRGDYIENSMLHSWANIYDAAGYINSKMETLAAEVGSVQQVMDSEELVGRLLSDSSRNIVYALRKSSATGAYVILDNPHQTSDGIARNGLYIHDSDPSTSSSDNSDLIIRCGAPELARKMGVTTDNNWSPHFMLDHSNSPMLDRPIAAARQNYLMSPEELGYWWHSTAYGHPEENTITYSLPLRTNTGYVYGVLAIELSGSYLQGQLPYLELDDAGSGTYAIVMTPDSGSSFESAAFSHNSHLHGTMGDHSIHLKPSHTRNDVSELQLDDSDADIVAEVHYMSLYDHNSPYLNEQWAVVGMIDQDSLTRLIDEIRQNAILSGLFCLVIVFLLATFIFRTLVRPIEALVSKLHGSSPHKPVELDKSGISEIDELAMAIEQMSLRVHESSSMLSRIIKLSNIKIAAFECDTVAQQTTYTDQFFPLLGLPQPSSDGYSLPCEQFRAIFDSWDYDVEEVLENGWLLRLSGDRRSVRWLRLIVMDYGSKLLGVTIDVTDDVMSKRRIEYERDYDLLTNLLNRRAFLQTLGRLFDTPERLKTAVMIMLDLDNLKHINDRYGHDVGDSYIEATANILKQLPIQNMVVARMSGDEFFVFMYGYDSVSSLQVFVDIIKDSIADTYFNLPGAESIRVRCSAGVAWYPTHSRSYEELIKQADFAMYTAKNTKKGDFCQFDSESYNRNSYLLHSREELNKLIDGNLVTYHFQPIVDARTGEVFAYEALMRSQLETLRSPLEVLALAKSQSKLYEIERITWFNALKLASGDLRFVDGGCKLFINSVSNQILTESDIKQLGRQYAPYLTRVVLEVTEEEKFTEDLTRRKQDTIYGWGGQVALDDFGTGYNGDIALLMISPDYVKIDMSIVRNIDTDSGRQDIFRNLVSYSQEHGIKVIAEGVETAAEMETLIRMGANYLQGYYIGRPGKQMASIENSITNEIKMLSGGTPEADEEIKI